MNQSAFKEREKGGGGGEINELRPALLAGSQESLGGKQQFKEICAGLPLTQCAVQRPQPGKTTDVDPAE